MTTETVVLDASALSAAARGTAGMLAWFTAALECDRLPVVSALTITEATDGSVRDAQVRRVLRRLDVRDVTPERAFAAGAMRAGVRRRKQRDLTVDAVVAATAASLPGPVVVLTSDASDLTALLEGTDVRVAEIA
jgi:predicted nucleic acid-binding protein